ncbi:MAG: S8 family serine peptidase [Sedimentisphaerales bacterium]
MKRQILISSLILLFVAAFAMADDLSYKAGALIVRFADPAASTQTKNNILNSAFGCSGSPVVKEYSIVPGLTLVKLPAGMTVEQGRVSLAQSSAILYAEPDYKRELYGVPNDTRFGELWGMNNTGQSGGTPDADIDAPEAWNISTGSSSVVVAVTDTGVDYTHPDLTANMWVNPGEIPGNGIDDDGDGFIDDVYGCDTGSNDGNPMDNSAEAGHGTHVSGTIGAVGNNARGVAGVCWNVKIMAVKIADANGVLYDSAIIGGIQYAINKNAKVINASWGGYGYSQAEYDVISAARGAGILFVAAAGNNGGNNDSMPLYPASFNLDNIIAVMATTNTDGRAFYSSYGLTSVDLGAPGGAGYGGSGDILSTLPGGGYGFMAGTSMATPHVAGACALLLSIDPSLTYTDVKQTLLDKSDPLPSLTGLCVSGGRLNLYKAAYEISHDTVPPSPDPAEWEIGPNATGLHTIAMTAKAATDRSGVEYFFGCVTDANFNSGWQSSTLYARGGFNSNTTYTFRVKYRDKSDNHNETGWSDPSSATTGSGSDTLPPFPNPSRWKIKPRALMHQTPPGISMEAMESSDEHSPLRYFFRCTYTDDPNDPASNFDSGWISSNMYTISSRLDVNSTYTFTVKARDALLNETVESDQASVTVGAKGTNILTVPVPYATIQDAINAASNGDTVEVRPGIYTGGTFPSPHRNRDLNFTGKAITVRSNEPCSPSVVAATIIDCQGNANNPHRAFDFNSVELSTSIVAGFTIRNGWMQGLQGFNGTPPGGPGTSGSGATGGAIVCVASSPTIRNCVITNCVAAGGNGGMGANGDSTISNGGNGGNAGWAKGGGIYCDPTSNPIINNCEMSGCVAMGGLAGPGGNGDAASGGNGGNGGDGGSAFGGAIYCSAGTNVIITNCRIINNNGVIAWVGAPAGQAGAGGLPGTAGANGQAEGGGVYYGPGSIANMSSTRVSNNDALIIGWDYVNPTVLWTVYGSQGGGIDCNVASSITLTNCYISNNEATDGDGGGIRYDHGGTMTLHGCTVSNNISDNNGYGGGIYAGNTTFPLGSIGSTTVIIDGNSTISGNTAAYNGGGLLLVETIFDINNSTISGNNAFEGAGVSAYDCNANVNNCTIRDNSVTELGGGFSFTNGLATINNSCLTGNSATGSRGTGGSLFFEGWSDNPHKITNCLITGNTAYSDGGGLSNNIGAWVKITNCTFAGNQVTGSGGVGGGISCAEYSAYVEIFNSILWGNQATAGGSQIAVGNPDGSPPGDGSYADVYVSYSDVQGGEKGVWLEDVNQTYTAFWWRLNGNIDEDPLFAKASVSEDTYFLSQITAGQLVQSPCVNAGNGSAGALEAIIGMPLTTRTDYETDYGPVDMGYHYQAGFDIPQYRLTIEVIDQGYGTFGTVLPEPNTYTFNQGEVVELHAAPDAGWQVYQWTGTNYVPVYPADHNYNTVTMDSDKTVTVEFEPRGAYKLVTHVIGNGTIEPAGLTTWSHGTVVPLTATPANPSEVVIWRGTDDDFSDSRNNTVTMNANKEVFAEFYAPKTLYVPGQYPTIQAAIDDSHDRDIIEISAAPQPYYTSLGFVIDGKAITITGTNPDDPCCVANTIIQTDYNTPATGIGPIFFFNNVGRNTVLNGLTIKGYNAYGGPGGDGLVCGVSGGNGPPISGGGISCGYIGSYGYYGNASPTIKNCIITDCRILGGNGGNGFAGCTNNPNGGDGGWPGRAYGAAMGCFYGSSPLVVNCTFRNNIATGGNGGNGGKGNDSPPGPQGAGGRGGGWYYGENSRWYNIPWPYGPYDLYTEYTGRGGAVYVGPGCSPAFIDCTFTNNRSRGGTNGISGTDGAPNSSMYEPSVHWNIDNFGGAAYVAGNSTVQFVGCAFNGNLADTNNLPHSSDLFVSYGGAVAFENGANIIFEECAFNGNLATIGGGMYWNWSDPRIDNCSFVGNSAFHGGGALFVGGTVNITRSDFSRNEATATAGQGGGICSLGANMGIVDCNISNNATNGSGGGIYISNKDVNGGDITGENTVLVKNCLITGNSASRDGGGISANWYSEPNIVNCTIADNIVTGTGFETGYGGGLYCSYSSYANVINSIIWGNLGNIGAQGSQLAVGTAFVYNPMPSTVNITYSDIQDATDPNAFGARIDALDLVFCIDSTGSMFDDIDAVKVAAYEITGAISTAIPNSRIAVVDYKDFNSTPYGGSGDYPYRTVLGFSTNTSAVIAAINSLTASGGGDTPEAVYTALMHCIDNNSLARRLGGDLHGASPASLGPGAWRSGNVMRVIILMGDAEPHDPEPFTNYTLRDIVAAADGAEPKRIVSLVIGSDANTAVSFGNLAKETGGTVLRAAGAGEVVNALMDAIELISRIPDPVLVDPNCTLNWDSNSYRWDPNSNNIDKDPCFVSGYYLSQIAAGQAVNSDCVDGGSNTAENLGMNTYTTRTDGMFDEGIVDMGYHYLYASWAEACRHCELFHDGIINFKDFAIFALNWPSEGCSAANDWCNHADVTFDSHVNFEDVLLFAQCWLFEDTYPPLPNPSQWAVEPYSSPGKTWIGMIARTTVDEWGGTVEYYFDCTYGGGHNSGWRNDPNYKDTGLVINTKYGYRVKARDAGGNETGWSPVRYAVVGETPPPPEDHNAPTPNPMTWATVPHAISATSIAMKATTATDDTAGVEYYFEDANNPARNSGWRSNPSWTDTTCQPQTTYTYRVRARDTSLWHNTTGWSVLRSATTPVAPPPVDHNPPAPVAWEVRPFETGSGLDAFANMTAAQATDPEGSAVQYYFECVGIPSINSGWMTEREWNNVSIGRAGQFLYFHFRVRDSASPTPNVSSWSISLPCYQ